MKWKIVYGLCLTIFSYTNGPLWGSNASSRGPAVLQMETGVRALGMGGAFTAVSDDASALYWNPAGLQQMKRQEVQLMRADSFAGQTQNFAAYTRPTWGAGERTSWGLSVNHLAMPTFQVLEEGEEAGSVRPQDYVVGISHARPFLGVSCGMTLKWVTTMLVEESGQTVAADLGFLGQGKGVSWGVTLANVGPAMTLGSEKESLPTLFRSGVSKRFQTKSGEWVAAGDVDCEIQGDPIGRIGVEYTVPLGRDWRASLRSGARTKEEGRFSFGGGLARGPLSFNYAFTAFGDLGSSSRVDFSLQFGDELKQEMRRRDLLVQSRDYMKRDDLAKAKVALEELKGISPRFQAVKELDQEIRHRYSESLDPANLLLLGKEAMDNKNYQEAANRFQKLLVVDPSHKEGKAMLSIVASRLEEERQSRIKEEVKRARGQQRVLREREAKARFAQKDWQTAATLWNKWIQLGGDPTRGKGEMARCWEQIYSEAEKALSSGDQEKALEIFKSIASYRDSEKRANKLAEVIQKQRAGLGKEKYEQGMEAYVAGDMTKAKSLFQEALSLNPDDMRARQALNRIREELRPAPGRGIP